MHLEQKEQNRSTQAVGIAHNINNSVYQAVKACGAQKPSRIRVKLLLNSNLWPVMAVPWNMDRIMITMIMNAFGAMESGDGELTIVTSNLCNVDLEGCGFDRHHVPGDHVYVRIAHTGPGPDDECKSEMTGPFPAKRLPGRREAMAAVSGIVQKYRGCIFGDDARGKGTVHHLFFPRSKFTKGVSSGPAWEPAPARESAAVCGPGGGTAIGRVRLSQTAGERKTEQPCFTRE